MNRILIALALIVAQHAGAATLCRLVSGGGLAFGIYDTLSTMPLDSVANVTVTCDRNGGQATETVTVSLGPGNNATSTAARRLGQTLGNDYLGYGLYRDVARSLNWGNTSGADTLSQTVSVPNHGSASLTFTIYGRVPAQQDVTAGAYSDSVQITVMP